jgi:hypothetical protein
MVVFEVSNAMALLLPPSAGLRRVFRVAPPRQDHADLSHRRKPRACCPSWPWSCLNVVQISKADFCMLIALSGSSLGKVSVPFVLIPCCHDHPSLSCPQGPQLRSSGWQVCWTCC